MRSLIGLASSMVGSGDTKSNQTAIAARIDPTASTQRTAPSPIFPAPVPKRYKGADLQKESDGQIHGLHVYRLSAAILSIFNPLAVVASRSRCNLFRRSFATGR